VGLDPSQHVITKEPSVKSSWFTRIAVSAVIASALAASGALAADAPTDSTKAAAATTKDAKKLAEETAKKNAADEKAKQESIEKAKKDAEFKADRDSGLPWVGGANWTAYRIGTAYSTVKNSPDGGIGVGFGMHHFMNRRWSAGLQADLDVLGKFSGGTEAELPLTLQMTRHMKFGSNTMRPYLGFGGGAYFHRYARTGGDEANLRPGGFFAGGFNTPIGPHSLLGFDVRMTLQGKAQSNDPLFPNESSTATHWSFKVAYQRWTL
jgi:hypothetical protein